LGLYLAAVWNFKNSKFVLCLKPSYRDGV